jgi:hypothetical protein
VCVCVCVFVYVSLCVCVCLYVCVCVCVLNVLNVLCGRERANREGERETERERDCVYAREEGITRRRKRDAG